MALFSEPFHAFFVGEARFVVDVVRWISHAIVPEASWPRESLAIWSKTLPVNVRHKKASKARKANKARKARKTSKLAS